jgi:hypothetical protein
VFQSYFLLLPLTLPIDRFEKLLLVPQAAGKENGTGKRGTSPKSYPIPKTVPAQEKYGAGDDDLSGDDDDNESASKETPPSSPEPAKPVPKKKATKTPTPPDMQGPKYPPAADDPTKIHVWITVQRKRGQVFLSKLRPKRKNALIYEVTRPRVSAAVFKTEKVDDSISPDDVEPYKASRKAKPLYDLLKNNPSTVLEVEEDDGSVNDQSIVLLPQNLLEQEANSPYQGIWSGKHDSLKTNL